MASESEIIAAVNANNLGMVRTLLEREPELANACNDDRVSAIMLAIYANRQEIRDALLSAGASIDVFASAALGNVGALSRILRTDSSSMNAFSPDGWTPLHLAAFFDNASIIELLITLGVDLNPVSRNPMRVMPLHSALSAKRWGIARMLIEHGADVHFAAGEFGLTPIHYAAANGSLQVVDLLLHLDANLFAKTNDGKTARDLAEEHGNFDIAEFLRGREMP